MSKTTLRFNVEVGIHGNDKDFALDTIREYLDTMVDDDGALFDNYCSLSQVRAYEHE